ncbi:MAG: hypothetical protein H6982_14735 [Chromatiales bacterium]|nr:hypothetical protein [Chromatiales bacterium]
MSPIEMLFGSSLVTSAVLGSVALVLYFLVRREVRVRPHALWSGEDAVSVAAAAFTMLVALAAILFFATLSSSGAQAPSAHEVGVSLGTVAASAIVAYLLYRFSRVEAGDGRLDRATRPGRAAAGMASG